MGIFINKNSQKGQILLIVILAAVVSLTVGLSAVSRIITNTRVTSEEASSQKALSAAEAGAEELAANNSLLGTGSSKTLSNNSKFDASAIQLVKSELLINGGNDVLKDDGADVWLSTYPKFTGLKWSGTMTVYWTDTPGSSNCNQNPAVEIVVISGNDRNNPNMSRAAYDSCGNRSANNLPSPANGTFSLATIPGVTFNHSANVVITNGFIARIIPLYANTKLAVTSDSPGNTFPSQGYTIESVGTSGNTTRKVRVFQGFPRVPIEYFPYNLFLPGL